MKRITADIIINRLLTEFGYKDLNKLDIYEYIGWAISEIGYGLDQEIAYAQAAVDFHKIPYPCDMIMYLNCYYKGKVLPRKGSILPYNQGAFDYLQSTIQDRITLLSETDLRLELERTGENRDAIISEIIESYKLIKSEEISVDLDNWAFPEENLIKTSLEEGNVWLQYTKVSTDSNGIPYIYNEVNYINAILYYCSFILIQRGYIHPSINYATATELKDRYFLRARNYEKRMDEEQKLDFINNWSVAISNVFRNNTVDKNVNINFNKSTNTLKSSEIDSSFNI